MTVDNGSGAENKDKYSILLPTYNEHDNLPIIVWLIVNYMDKRWAFITLNYIHTGTISCCF